MRILITGAWKCESQQLDEIKSLGHEVVLMPDERGEIPFDPCEIDGVICNGLFLYHSIEKFSNLKYIQLTSAGYDRVPMESVQAKGIVINNARGVYSIPMAEYAVCGVLQLYKRTSDFLISKKARKWQKIRSISELYGKTVAIIGAGSVGNECAKRFSCFGCTVIGVDAFPVDNENFSKILHIDHLFDALAIADVVILTLPLTEETKHLIGKLAFDTMRQGVILVNIARGPVVDTTALICALESGKLGGAVLDVFEEEPLTVDSQLWNFDNVILTPHNSFVGEGNLNRLNPVILNNLKGIN